MKKLLTFLLLMGFAVFMNGQNWQPVNLGNSYNYILGDGEIITNVIKIDSVEIIDGDSVYYFNRIMTNCDTCSNNDNGDFALRNQPQFMMRKMIKKSDSLLVFADPEEFILRPLADVDETWTFDSVNAITATCSSIEEATVLVVLDSLKTITLSNSKQILLSKQYGIISFPSNNSQDYSLVGIEGNQNIGEKLPGFYEFYDFTVGDVFQKYSIWGGGGDGDYNAQIEKYIIQSKEALTDTIRYLVTKYKAAWGFDSWEGYIDTTFSTSTKTIKYTNSPSIFVNRYPNQLYDFDEFFWNYLDFRMLNKTVFTKENGLWVKYAGASFEDWDDIYPHYDVNDSIPDLLEKNNDGPQYVKIKFIEGYGREYMESGFEYYQEEYFMGRVHNGDTTGTIYGNRFFQVGIESLDRSEFKLFPNPAKSEIRIEMPNSESAVQISIIDMMGRMVYKKVLSNDTRSHEVDISGIEQGVYVLQLSNGNRVLGMKRFVKQ